MWYVNRIIKKYKEYLSLLLIKSINTDNWHPRYMIWFDLIILYYIYYIFDHM